MQRLRVLAGLSLPMLAAAAALLSGCAGGDFRTTNLPSREGSTSPLVRYAYFAPVMNVTGTGISERQLPGGYTAFDPERDERVVFVVGINSPGRNFAVHGTLARPDGMTLSRFRKQFTWDARYEWYYWSTTFPMADLKPHPGEWKVDLSVDNQPVGIFTFLLGDSAAIARLKRERATPAAAPPPLVTLKLTGPAGVEVRINEQRHPLPASGVLSVRYPPGTYVVEVARPGFLRWYETVRLTAEQPVVERTIVLSPLVPPSLVVLEPGSGTVVAGAEARLKLRVTSPHRLRLLRVVAVETDEQRGYEPDAGVRPGVPWVFEPVVTLAEGTNTITLVATDENDQRTEQVLTLVRRSLVAAELRGPPNLPVRVNEDRYRLDARGVLALRLPAGTHAVEASREGFLPWRESITVAPGQPAVVRSITLAPRPAAPSAPATPPPTDTEPPRIAINHPPPDSKVEREHLVIVALVTDNVAVEQVQVSVNGVAVAAEKPAAGARGHPVRAAVALHPGENVIEISAVDRAGNAAQAVRTVTRVVPAPVAAPPPVPARQLWAVVIGIGQYEARQIPSLKYTVADAEAFYAALTGTVGLAKERVLLLTDRTERKPTLRNIRYALGTFLSRSARKDDTVLIFFAGHGAPEVDPRGFERDGLAKYLIPADADPDDLYSTALPMDELQTIFARIEAERVVAFLDACYSGAAGGRTFVNRTTRTGSLDDLFLERLARSKGRAIVTASRPSEVSIELPELGHGIFTYYLLSGLRGAADLNRDGIVSLHELYDYLSQEVARKSREVGGNQHPVMKGEIEGILPLSTVLTAPGRGGR